MAARDARRRAARRRVLMIGLAGAVAVIVVVVLLLSRDGDDKSNVAAGSTTVPTPTSEGAMASAAGKPCVPVSEPLPAGAPAVGIKEGPPPAQLVKEDLKPGTGAEVTPGATVTAHYIGVACSTGKIFDSSYSRGAPATFPLTNVIKGWQDGLPGMKVGGTRLLGIPAEQAYGATGRPGSIAPDEALWFVVEMTDSKPA